MYDYYRQRGPNPLFYEDPHYNTSPPFQIPPFPVTYNPRPHYSFFGWIGGRLNYVMILWIYTCGALVPSYQKDLDVCFMH